MKLDILCFPILKRAVKKLGAEAEVHRGVTAEAVSASSLLQEASLLKRTVCIAFSQLPVIRSLLLWELVSFC